MDPTTLLGLLAVLLVFVKTIGSASGHVYNGLMLLVVFGLSGYVARIAKTQSTMISNKNSKVRQPALFTCSKVLSI